MTVTVAVPDAVDNKRDITVKGLRYQFEKCKINSNSS